MTIPSTRRGVLAGVSLLIMTQGARAQTTPSTGGSVEQSVDKWFAEVETTAGKVRGLTHQSVI